MSNSTSKFCDACGQLLYHSVHVYSHEPVRSWTYRWFWHGDARRGYPTDICQDCMRTIAVIVAANRDKIKKIKEKSVNKSPNELMENPPKLTVRRIKNILGLS